MKKVDARGDACPIPVVKAKHAIEELSGAGQVEVLVDNEIAVQNLTKMAEQKGYQSSAKKTFSTGEGKRPVRLCVKPNVKLLVVRNVK